jgi:hypothetical protein
MGALKCLETALTVEDGTEGCPETSVTLELDGGGWLAREIQ